MRISHFAAAAALVAASAGSALADSFHDLLSFQGATANRTLINFDVDPSGAPIGPGGDVELLSTYASVGAVFPRGNRSVNTFGGPVSSPRGWLNDTQVGSDRVFDVDITAAGITAIGVHNVFFGSTPAGATLTAFGAGGAVLATVDSNADPSTLDFFGLTTAAPITRMTVAVHQAGGWGLDDLYLGQVVPAPSATAALGLGLLVAGRRRRA